MTALSSGDLRKDYRRFAVPSVLGLAVFSLYSMVDGIFVGRLVGPEALAAVNLSAPFMNLMFALAVTLAVGSGTLIATALGEGEPGRANALFSQNLATATAVGVALGAFMLVFLDPVCRALGAGADTLADTRAYVGTIACFAPVFVVEYNLEVLIKTDGHPRLSLGTVLGASLMNLVLDWLFIGPFGMGVFGAALATGLSQTMAMAVFLGHFLWGKKRSLGLTAFRFSWPVFGKMVPIGLPDGSMELCAAAMTWLYNRLILLSYGTMGVAAFTVISYVNLILLNILTGTSQGMQPLVSYHAGAGEGAACRKLLGYALKAQAVLGLAAFVFLECFPGAVAGLFFGPEEEALRLFAAGALRKFSFAFLILGFNLVTAGYLTAREKPVPALAVSLGRGFVLQAAVLLLLFALFGGAGLWWAALGSELLVAGLSLLFLKKLA